MLDGDILISLRNRPDLLCLRALPIPADVSTTYLRDHRQGLSDPLQSVGAGLSVVAVSRHPGNQNYDTYPSSRLVPTCTYKVGGYVYKHCLVPTISL